MRMPWAKTPLVDDERPPAEEVPVFGNSWTMGSRLAVAATTIGLWLAILCGPAALALAGWHAARPAPTTSASAVVDQARTSAQLRAEEFAVRAVSTWLSASRGQEDLVRALLPQTSSVVLPATGMKVSAAMVADSRPAADDVWAVTVAATVGDSRMVARRFFVIPVKVEDQTVLAVALPAEIPSSLLAAAEPGLDYRVDVPSSSALYTTAGEFLGAFLVGQGDVARVISPSASIRAVLPAPYTSVKVSGISAHEEVSDSPRDGTELDILVTATAQVSDQERVVVQYPLTLRVRAGRWEVSAVRDTPLIAARQPSPTADAAPAETASPSPTPTTPSASPTQQ